MTKNAVSARLSEPTAPEVAATIYEPSMKGLDAAGLERMCALNEAHAVMLADRGLIAPETARALLGGIARIRHEGVHSIDLNPQFEDTYFAFESRLGAVAGKTVTGWLHIGRSRNDIGATLDRMQARDVCLALREAMAAARHACLEAVERHAEVIMPGYTHLQPAQPITFGYYLLNVASGLEREHDRIAAAYPRIDVCPLGSAAFAGTSFTIDRDLTARLLGFSGPMLPGLDAVASRDFVTELLWAVTSTATLLSRIAQDFYAFTTHEFAALRFPDRVAGTSSIMPQKKNMLPLEFFRAEAGRAIGALAGCLSAVKGSNYSIGLDSVREGVADAWPVFARFQSALPLLRLIFETAEPDRALLERRCLTNFSTATDLADGLVRVHGLSFREAHHVVGHAVRLVLAAGGDASALSAAIVDEAAESKIGRRLGLDESTVRAWLDPRAAVSARSGPGGPAPAEVLRRAGEAHRRLETEHEAIRGARGRLAAAAAELGRRAEALGG
ncbi:MAG: argininosuccinate lyase [Beijerinckiaceae bacterium]